jgi:hypothetical protein
VNKIVREIIVTVVGFGILALWVIPYFTGKMAEVGERPIKRIEARQKAAMLEEERRAQRETDLMSNVHRLVREEKQRDRPSNGVSGPPVRTGPSQAEIEQALEQWYRKPDYCNSTNDRTFTACASDHVKKRAEFDKLVAAGKLP